jgi:hypothetical protein
VARPISEKCRQCSKVSVEAAQTRDCWEGQRCHVRRSRYKHRSRRNVDRKQQRHIQQDILEAPPSEAIAAIAISIARRRNRRFMPMPLSSGRAILD